jgi:hypothetical protein
MDYRRARFDEDPDPRFLARHRAQIAPLLRLRSIFAGSRNLHLLDFSPAMNGDTGSEPPEEAQALDSVVAFCNRSEAGAALVVVHNDSRQTSGSLHRVARLRSTAPEDATESPQLSPSHNGPRDLLEALEIEPAPHRWLLVHDPRTGIADLWASESLARRGLALSLEPFATRVWIGFEVLDDPAGELAAVAAELGVQPLEIWRQRLRELGHESRAGDEND